MKIRKIIVIFILLFSLYIFESCGSLHTSVGLNMSFGPNGPYVSPSIGVNMYGGGRW